MEGGEDNHANSLPSIQSHVVWPLTPTPSPTPTMTRRIFLILPLLVLMAGLHPAMSFTATTGDLAGIVKDKQGKAVGNAVVRVLAGPELGEARADAQGRYRLANLDPGSYEIVAIKPGYVSVRKTAVAITANAATTLNF